jgi:hypothetical protein
LFSLFVGLTKLYIIAGQNAPTRQLYDFKGCSEQALAATAILATGVQIEPSRPALQAHIADLEADLRSVDFRLQNFYHQRTVIAGILESALARLQSNFT